MYFRRCSLAIIQSFAGINKLVFQTKGDYILLITRAFIIMAFFSCLLVFPKMNAYANQTSKDINEKTYNTNHLAAIEMARSGKNDQALAILENLLQQQEKPSYALLYDYIAVLEWSGQHQQAINAFSKQSSDFQKTIPAYTKEALANAFYSIGDYKQALVFYEGSDNNLLQQQKSKLFLGILQLDEVTSDTQLAFALDLAKQGLFEKSLAIYQKFYSKQQLSLVQLYDYIIVLFWSGKEEVAAEIFEQQTLSAEQLPDYMLLNIGNIYEKLQLADKAKIFYQLAVQRGSKEGKLALSSLLLKQSEDTKALDILSSIDQSAEQPEPYILRAKTYLAAGRVFEAALDYEKALSLIPQGDTGRKQQIVAEQAVLFLRAGEYVYSIELLSSYIEKGQATVNMQCDYIYALQMNESYKTGLEAAQKMWPDITSIPAYGLLAAGNCALALGEEKIALSYYEQVAKSSAAEKEVALTKIAQIKK